MTRTISKAVNFFQPSASVSEVLARTRDMTKVARWLGLKKRMLCWWVSIAARPPELTASNGRIVPEWVRGREARAVPWRGRVAGNEDKYFLNFCSLVHGLFANGGAVGAHRAAAAGAGGHE